MTKEMLGNFKKNFSLYFPPLIIPQKKTMANYQVNTNLASGIKRFSEEATFFQTRCCSFLERTQKMVGNFPKPPYPLKIW